MIRSPHIGKNLTAIHRLCSPLDYGWNWEVSMELITISGSNVQLTGLLQGQKCIYTLGFYEHIPSEDTFVIINNKATTN